MKSILKRLLPSSNYFNLIKGHYFFAPSLTISYPNKESIISVGIRFTGVLLFLFILIDLTSGILCIFNYNVMDLSSLIVVKVVLLGLLKLLKVIHISKSITHLKKITHKKKLVIKK